MSERAAPRQYAGQMTTSRTTRSSVYVKTCLWIFVMVIFGPLGNILLRSAEGVRDAGLTLDMLNGRFGAATWISFQLLGIACLITFLIANMLVLSWADYSYVQPTSAVAYGVVALLGYFVLGEDVSRTRWIGVVVICLGVLMIGRTSPRTTETDS